MNPINGAQRPAKRQQGRHELARLASFPELNPNPILEIDPDGCITYINPFARQLFPDLRDKGVNHPYLGNWRELVEKMLKEGALHIVREVQVENQFYQQSVYYVKEYQCLRVYGLDITKRKQAEAELERSVTSLQEAVREIERSRAQLEAIFAAQNDAVLIYDTEMVVKRANPSFMTAYGFDPVGLHVKEIVQRVACRNLDGRPFVMEEQPTPRALSGEKVTGASFLITLPDGSDRVVETSSGPIREGDRITGTVTVWRDITERKQAEEALQQSDALLRAVMEGTPDPVFLKDCNSRILLANPATMALVGKPAEQVIGKNDLEMYDDPGVGGPIMENDRLVMESGQTQVIEERVAKPEGDRIFLSTKTPYRDATGKVIGIIGIAHDITDRKAREEELGRLNRTLKAVSNCNQSMMRAENENTLMEAVCKIVVEDCGHAMAWIGFAEQDDGKTVRPVAFAGFEDGYLEVVHNTWSNTKQGRGPTGTAIRTGKPSICRNIRIDPAFKPWRAEAIKRGFASSIVLPLVASGKAFGALTIYSKKPDPFSEDEVKLLSELANDLSYGITTIRLRTSNAQAGEALRTSEENYRRLIENVNDLVCEVDAQARYQFVSAQYKQVLGYAPEELLGKYVRELIHPDDLALSTPSFQKQINGKTITRNEWRFRHKNGEWRWFDCAAQTYEKSPGVVHVVVISRDITERKKMEEELRRSEERYRSLFTGMTEGFALHEIICDENDQPCDYRFIEINPSFERQTGLHREDVIGKLHNQILPDDDPNWVKIYGEVALSGRPIHFENYSPALKHHYEVFAYCPAPRQFAVLFLNITERKRSEEMLRQRSLELEAARLEAENEKRRLEAVMEALPVGMAITDALGGNIRSNSAFEQIWGQPRPTTSSVRDYAAYKAWWADTGKPLAPQEWASAQVLMQGQPIIGQLLEIERFDGSRAFVINSASPVRDSIGKIVGSAVALQDITNLREAEHALAEVNAQLELRVRERTEDLQTLNEELMIEIAERKQAEETIRQQAVRSETLAEVSKSLAAARLDQQTIFDVVTRSAAEHIGDTCCIYVLSEDGQWLNPASLYNTDPVQQERLYKTVSTLPLRVGQDIPDQITRDGQSLRLSPVTPQQLAEMTRIGYQPLIEDQQVTQVLVVPMRQEGKTIGVIALIRGPQGLSYTSEDVTLLEGLADRAVLSLTKARLYKDLQIALEREQQTRQQLIQAEKNSALARMVASVAHEINNPIQTIKNCMYLLKDEIEPNSEAIDVLDMAVSEANRIGDLVSRLRELYRPSKDYEPKLFNILDVLGNVHSLLTPHLQHHNVQWNFKTDTDFVFVNVIADKIKQVFLNICLNAIDAMENKEGSLTVEVSTRTASQVSISFKDTGKGISPEDMPHIFEPFYTTKEKGSGLGLSICHEIVNNFNGKITVDSQPGQGATFTVWLPVVERKGF